MESFKGKWITAKEFRFLPVNRVFHRQLDPVPPEKMNLSMRNKHILYRRKFTLKDLSRRVKLCLTADDYYKLYVNGKFITQGPCPGYHFHYFFNEIDLTEYLKPGENTLAVHTFYQGLINRVWQSGDNRHGMICDLFAGDTLLLRSDESFLIHTHSAYSMTGIAGYDTTILERYDSSAPEVGFEQPDFDDSAWEHAVIDPNADYTFFKQTVPNVMQEEIHPAKITRNGRKITVDFGGIYVGNITFKATGPAGSVLPLKYAQELEADSSLRWKMRCNCTYAEEFVLSGKPQDVLDFYDYKTFRYAQIELPEGAEADTESIRFLARHQPFERKAKLSYPDEASRKIWDLCVSSLHYGVQEVIQDCMDRERGYYLGDGCYSMLAYCLLRQDYSMMEKFFDDFLITARISPGLITCSACSFMQEIAEYPLIMMNLALFYCRLTGNTEFIRRRWEKLLDVMENYRTLYAAENGMLHNLDRWCVVEWPESFRDGYDAEIEEGKVCTDTHNAINAYYVGAVKSLNRIAEMIGKPPVADEKALQEAFVQTFYVPEKKLFRDRAGSNHISLPANVFAWYYQLAPEPEAFEENMLKILREYRLTRSLFFEAFPILSSLIRSGHAAFAHELVTDPGAWLRMISEDGTQTFEGWGRDSKSNASLFHLTLTLGALFLTDWDIAGTIRFDR